MNVKGMTLVAALGVATLVQGCAAIGPAVGLAAVAATKQNAGKTVDWADRIGHMNCSQMRGELTGLKRKDNFFTNVLPGNNTSTKLTVLRSEMRRKGCRMS